MPDDALIQPCDRTETDPTVNAALALELSVTRRQRNDCADRMDGVRQWKADAIKRHAELTKAQSAPLPK